MKHLRTTCRQAAVIAALGTASLGIAACGQDDGGGDAADEGIVIAFSQSFSSNSWQAANVAAAQQAADILISEGKIADYIFADANNDVNTQVSQINSMILEKPDVILIDPTSATGLNGVIEKADQAGIPVLVFCDGPVTSDIPWDMEAELAEYTEKMASFIVNKLGGKGNVLNVRGMAGTGADEVEQQGTDAAFSKASGIQIVGEVYGSWDEATAQSAVAQVLPGLPEIDAVMQQGGSGYGIAQAFEAAGRPVPLIVMGNRGEELQWWREQAEASDYETISINPNPGMGASAVYVGYAIASGQDVPKKLVVPNLEISQADLDKYADLKMGDVAFEIYDQAWTQTNIIDKARG
ncbi:MAG: substrate-binding domain-containing protein [Bifidobacteriaceae bacterium]|jgi:ribose transport system substrate-binding protein|nr:substrate-binding domain-containing protein [Bifidobacteriaceae bacterium]